MIPERIEMYRWIFKREEEMFGDKKNIEVIFVAANIIDKYCSLRKIRPGEYRLYARAAFVISAQYNSDEYEFVCKSSPDLNRKKVEILETINYNIFPPRHLKYLYDLNKDSDKKTFVSSFLYLIVSIFDFDTESNFENVCAACFYLASDGDDVNPEIQEISVKIYERTLWVKRDIELLIYIKKYIPSLLSIYR
jgi:hypothetical protein